MLCHTVALLLVVATGAWSVAAQLNCNGTVTSDTAPAADGTHLASSNDDPAKPPSAKTLTKQPTAAAAAAAAAAGPVEEGGAIGKGGVTECEQYSSASPPPGASVSSTSARPVPLYKCCPPGQVLQEVASSQPALICTPRHCSQRALMRPATTFRCVAVNTHTALALDHWQPQLYSNHSLTEIAAHQRVIHWTREWSQCPPPEHATAATAALTSYVLHDTGNLWYQLQRGLLYINQFNVVFSARHYCRDIVPAITGPHLQLVRVCMQPAPVVSALHERRVCYADSSRQSTSDSTLATAEPAAPGCYRKCCPLNMTLVQRPSTETLDFCAPLYTDATVRPLYPRNLLVGLPAAMATADRLLSTKLVFDSRRELEQYERQCIKFSCPYGAMRLANGDLLVPSRLMLLSSSDCCLDTHYVSDDGGATVSRAETTAYCSIIHQIQVEKLIAHTLYVSSVCLVITLVGLASLYRYATLHDMCLASHAAALLTVFALTAASYHMNHYEVCFAYGALIYFNNMAAYIWLNIINYNIWRSIRNSSNNAGVNAVSSRAQLMSTYLRYSFFGWGLPLLMSCAMMAADQIWQSAHNPQLSTVAWAWPLPDIAFTYCRQPFNRSAIVYYFVPTLVLTLPSGFFFTSTVLYLVRHYRHTTTVSAQTHAAPMHQLTLYVKLFLAMEMFWVIEAVIVLTGVNNTFLWVTLINSTCGVSTLVMFLAGVNNRKRIRLCWQRVGRQWQLLQTQRRLSSRRKRVTSGTGSSSRLRQSLSSVKAVLGRVASNHSEAVPQSHVSSDATAAVEPRNTGVTISVGAVESITTNSSSATPSTTSASSSFQQHQLIMCGGRVIGDQRL